MTVPASPFDRLEEFVPAGIREIMGRQTPIPSIAVAAGKKKAETPTLVRADIGQISGVDADHEVYYGPPVGLEPLRTAVAELWNRTFGLEGTVGFEGGWGTPNVVITTGAAEGIALTMRCFAENRRVGLPTAHWENYANAISAAGGQASFVEFFDEHGRLDIEGLDRAMAKEKLAVLVLNFPANPTGAVLNSDEMTAIAELGRKHDLIFVADEVYARLRYDGQPPQTFLKYAPERTISVSSASKEYLLPGARVGYVCCADSRFTDQVLRRLIRANTASPNVLGQRRLLALLEDDVADLRAGQSPRHFMRVLEAMETRRDALVTVLEKHGFPLRGRAGHRPEGTIFLMAGLPNWWQGSDAEFAQAALETGCVSTIPGHAFGLPGTVRFSYGGLDSASIAQLDTNLQTFKTHCEKS